MKMHVYGMGVNPFIMVYSDASYMTHKDGRSHGGTAVYIGTSRCAIYCKSNKIRFSCSSSTDAEVYELRDGTYIGDYIRRVLLEFGLDCRVIYLQDNESGIVQVTGGTHKYDKKRKTMTNCINNIHDYLLSDEGNVSIISIRSRYMDAYYTNKTII